MIEFFLNISRLIKIIVILSISGAIFPVRKIKILYIFIFPLDLFSIFYYKIPKGKRLLAAFSRLGPTFIKLGQTLSTRPDIVGDDIALYLEDLRDKLPPFSTKKAIKIIEEDFSKKIDELFLTSLTKPVAAASIAQIYKAETIDNQIVAIKIIRPNINKKFSRDIKLLYLIADILNISKLARRLKIREVVATFEDTIKKELDLRFEAAAADELRDNNVADSNLHIPTINWSMVSKRVMVLEWIEGVNIDNITELDKRGYDRKKIAHNFIISYLNQVYRDGFFHADMHPGNIMIDKDQRICVLDFGIMGRLSYDDRKYVTQIFYGFLKRDYKYVAEVHLKAGYIPKNTSVMDFALACRSIGEPIVGMPVKDIAISKMLAQLFKITKDFGMETQPQLLLLQKTMLLIEGVAYKLDPEVNIWQISKPWLENWAKENMSVKNNIKHQAKMLLKIPDIIENFIKTASNIKRDAAGGSDMMTYIIKEQNFNKLLLIANFVLLSIILFGFLFR